MNIGIAGLGLIGGSLAKACKRNTPHIVWGDDRQPAVLLRARMLEAIDSALTPELLPDCDILLMALYPQTAITYLQEIAPGLSAKTLVIDCCGIKREICQAGFALAEKHGFTFIGGHPMAGIERFGFDAAVATLFHRASMVLTPSLDVHIETLEKAKLFFLSLGFGKITITTPEAHDRIIAYTSQLPHVLSSAYIKSDTALRHHGLSAGSFRDMSRVATLNPDMWSELFLHNREFLLAETDGLIARLQEYRDALASADSDALHRLLDEGQKRKAEIARLDNDNQRSK